MSSLAKFLGAFFGSILAFFLGQYSRSPANVKTIGADKDLKDDMDRSIEDQIDNGSDSDSN